MLAEAHRLAREDGAYVIVVVARHSEIARLRDQFLHDFCEIAYVRIAEDKVSLVSGGSVLFTRDCCLDWRTMRFPSAHPRCITLIDHFAIESAFGPMLAMLHRYDPRPEDDAEHAVTIAADALVDDVRTRHPETATEGFRCPYMMRLVAAVDAWRKGIR